MELPQVDPKVHKDIDSVYKVVREQTVFLFNTVGEIDSAFQQQLKTMIPRYKTVNLELKTTKSLVAGMEEQMRKNT